MNLEEFLHKTLAFVTVDVDGEWKDLSDGKNPDGFYFVEDKPELQFATIANVYQNPFDGSFSIPDLTGRSFKIKISKGVVVDAKDAIDI